MQPGTGAYKAASLLDSMTLPQARKMVGEWMKDARPDQVEYFKEVADTLAAIPKKSAVKQAKPSGNIYQVDLPDEQIARMIDWDKPLSEQSEAVQEAVAKLRDVPLASGDRTIGGELFEGATGMDLMMALKKTNPETFFGPRYGAQSSEMLRQAGIPGIRYLDQGSRGAGQGTSNFVVFPGMEDMLRIEQINEQPIQSLFQTLGR